jgi:hypothetical protein
MKKNYCLKAVAYFACYCLFFFSNGFSQTNLIPNCSFEIFSSCPIHFYSPLPSFWYFPTNYADCYANSCSNDPIVSVPFNQTGSLVCYQYARTGNAYVSLFYRNGNDWRNYVQVKINSILKQNKKYYAEHYINMRDALALACNNIGMLFTNTTLYVDTINYPYGVLPANPQIINYGNPVITDTMNWVKVSGVFKATGGEQYLTLGNFKYDANTVFKYVNINGYYGACYNIDDVAVYELDSFNLKADAGKDTTITLGDSVFIGTYTNGIDSLKWQLQTTGVKIDSTRPGFWVKPTVSTCYILTQTVNGFTSSDTVCINVNPLPLKFISFLVVAAPSHLERVGVRWQTANEINVSHFNIQRSINGRDFITVGKVGAKGNDEYSFIDPLGNLELGIGNLYYKIMAVDFDGRKTYSQIKSLNINHSSLNVMVFPNPAKDVVNISCVGMKQLLIIDFLGRRIQQFNNITELQTPNSKQTITINTKQFTKGIYMMQVTTNKGEVKNEKLVIE